MHCLFFSIVHNFICINFKFFKYLVNFKYKGGISMQRIILNRLFYIIIGTFIGSSLVYLGCGDSGGINSPLAISAKNIIFRNSQNAALSQKAPSNRSMFGEVFLPSAYGQDASLDETIKVLAENVLLETDDNSLESENLQDALDNEMAINIPSALSGKSWSVENRSALPDLDNCQGQITFSSSSSVTIESGKLAVPGIWSKSADRSSIYGGNGFEYQYSESATIEFLSNSVIWVTWQTAANSMGPGVESKAIVHVIPVNRGKFILTGYNPVTGHYGVSILTLAQ
jgi:hypothetical protein